MLADTAATLVLHPAHRSPPVCGTLPSLAVDGGVFSQCDVDAQGGAMHVSGTGTLRVDDTVFEDCSVGYSAKPICLTLTMIREGIKRLCT